MRPQKIPGKAAQTWSLKMLNRIRVFPQNLALGMKTHSSSRLIRKKGYPPIQKKLWGGSIWPPGYFAGSCGGALSLFCGSISKLNERPIKGKNSSYGAPYIPALNGEALRRAG